MNIRWEALQLHSKLLLPWEHLKSWALKGWNYSKTYNKKKTPKIKFQFYLHYAVPIVSCWHPEEQQERHAEVFECGVTPETFAWVEFIANWWSEK